MFKSKIIIIEDLRKNMLEIAEEKGDLTDPAVVELSRKLDELIIEVQHAYAANNRIQQKYSPAFRREYRFLYGKIPFVSHET